VTTTRNVGASERGLRPPWTPPGYPRIVYAGPVITVPGGYPSGVYPEIAAPVTSVPEAIAKVDALVARGARVIKIAIQTGPDGRQPTLSVEQVRAIVAAAHRHRRIVTAHLPGGRELAIALAGGVDELAHMPCVDVTRDQISVLVERRIAVVGTLHFGELFVRRQFPRCEFAATAREFVRQGGRLLYGTDIPGVPRRLDLTELGLMQKAGMAATDILRAATADAGKQLGMAPLGALVPGGSRRPLGCSGRSDAVPWGAAASSLRDGTRRAHSIGEPRAGGLGLCALLGIERLGSWRIRSRRRGKLATRVRFRPRALPLPPTGRSFWLIGSQDTPGISQRCLRRPPPRHRGEARGPVVFLETP
jgi:Amidohydrolase family